MHAESGIRQQLVRRQSCRRRCQSMGERQSQPAPWSNYIFIPELPEDENFDNAARAEYFKTNPDIAVEMQDLKQLNKELENEQPDFNPAEQPE